MLRANAPRPVEEGVFSSRWRLSATGYLLSVICYLLSVICYLCSVDGSLPSVPCSLLSVIGHLFLARQRCWRRQRYSSAAAREIPLAPPEADFGRRQRNPFGAAREKLWRRQR